MTSDNFHRRAVRGASAFALGLLLAACGGGAGAALQTTAAVSAGTDATASSAIQQKLQTAPGTVTLAWSATAGSITGYRIYYGLASRNYQQPLGQGVYSATATLPVTGLTTGQANFFAVTAIDASGRETPYSDETIARAP